MNDSKLVCRGFYRIQLGEGDKIIEDSGWKRNMVTTSGRQKYIAATVGAVSGSMQVGYVAVGTGTTAIASNATALGSESADAGRKAVSASTSVDGTFQATAEWSSTDITTSLVIAEVGLFASNAGGSMCAGQTYDVSTWATNQNLSATYQLRFSTA